MASEWRETTIGQLLTEHGGSIKTGPFGTVLKASEYSVEGVPLISVREVGYGSLHIDNSTPRVSPSVTERLPEYLLCAGDIVFGRKGAVDRSAYVKQDQEGWFLGSDGIRLRLPKVCNARFMAYQIQSLATRNWLVQHATGTTMASLNQNVIARVPIIIPPLPQQNAIAHVLSLLDDKIHLNSRMNETLEAMARLIFKDWFVDFSPTRAKAEGCPSYLAPDLWSLFPDSFNDEDTPVGWILGRLGDVAEGLTRSVDPGDVAPDTPYIGLEHMPRRSIALESWEGAGKVTSGKLKFVCGEFLFGKLRPYFHKVGIAPLDGICSTDIIVCKPKENSAYSFVLAHISSAEFVAYTDQTSTGTKMPRTSWSIMARYEIVIPPGPLLVAFNLIVAPLIDHLSANIHESRTLAQLRDLLLPKLMSGKIRLHEAEKLVGERV
jgi:type I restriction enzyme S subunit